MSAITLNFPAGVSIVTVRGADHLSQVQLIANANGQVTTDTKQVFLSDLLNQGFTVAIGNGPTGSRPTTTTYPGMTYLDTTLNSGAGMLIVRNAANSGWINPATGASV